MSDQNKPGSTQIDKQHISAMASFAIRNIPEADERTLNKFVELMHTTGSFGSLTEEQLVGTINLTMKYLPNACAFSLLTLLDLLSVYWPLDLKGQERFLRPGRGEPKLMGINRNDSNFVGKSSLVSIRK
ncbi:MAG: hypothetical protein H6631_20140 [Anaerolineaceae bacterium]|nr:hypothetical protein [Anaerolineaceae bacterium]MCB9101287.1 hypothetical protein [Anaerolineales bacterium]